ncbi:TIGR04283 family arsenosugar biosynthesis glycosyltransferase [Flagellimonas lutaonensis]|uniref:Glycosyl transferase n=1 Tax=Flagellimonas lutaonensis TaxID=516051 RepID=A0A0D5YNB6_9FLAO|nr:TIGR04283 family arsenosugar biosynthesis glycosyltransferase [Allomuricauda lutaonensis]AKA33815.1 glycosyl transferase [Allomuricauda lutaonensis]
MISIIIPVYNEKNNLEKLLPHLSNLAVGHEVEIIVSKGVCAVDYLPIVNSVPNAKQVAEPKKGRAVQMNAGAAAAKGAILAFLHADVWPPQGFFDDILKTLSSGYDAGFFSYRFDKDSFFLNINASFTKKDGIFTGGGDQCLFIKKSIFNGLGGFDEEQVLMEDFEFFRRMKAKRVRYKIVANDLIVSARKYENNSYLRINLTNLLLVVLFKMGYPPHKLKNVHDRLLRIPYRKQRA